ncbi:hypothetical protein F2Q68_00035146 [Brassica cretica]|uniref:Uncharacterized protein n=1 Tax=Brassica cretica TaxID=69181 RepID=A0A8S9GWM5_BRACR|nr:hypothetical protein F2Q68_00035146 [Brassica cretica]
MVEPDDYATKDKRGWLNGKLEDEQEAGVEHAELIFAVKIMSNKMEKMWISLMDDLSLFLSLKEDQYPSNMARDVSKRKEAPTVKLNKFQMEEMMSEIMRRTKKSDLLQKKHADDFFDNVSQVQKEAKIKRRSQDVSSVTRCPERNPPPDQLSSSTKSLLERRQYLLSKEKSGFNKSDLLQERSRPGRLLDTTIRRSRGQSKQSREETKPVHSRDDQELLRRALKRMCSPQNITDMCNQIFNDLEKDERQSTGPSSKVTDPRICCSKQEQIIQELKKEPSKVLEENSAEEVQKSSPPEEVLEQPNIEAETYAKSLSLNSQEHCKDLDMVNSLPEMFVLFMEHNKSLDYPEKTLELILQQPVLCSRKSFDSFVFKENSFVLSCSKHKIATGYLFSSLHFWKEFMVRNFQKPKSLRSETDKPVFLCYESDKPWHVLRSLLENCVVLSFDDILVYNTFFDKQAEPWLRDSRFELDLLCSESEELVPVLKLFFRNYAISCLDTILVYNTYFHMHHQGLKHLLHNIGKESFVFDLNKGMCCTDNSGYLVSVLSVQEQHDQSQRRKANTMLICQRFGDGST